MSASTGYLGTTFLLKLESATTPGTFVTVGGMRSNDMDMKAGFYDVTTKDGTRWKKQIEGGIKSMTFSGSGIWLNETVQKAAIAACMAGNIKNWEIVAANGDMWSGPFAATSFKRSGGHDGIEEFSLTLESAGDVTVTAGAA